MIDLTAADFFGSLIFLPILSWGVLCFLDGIGLILRDSFFYSRSKR